MTALDTEHLAQPQLLGSAYDVGVRALCAVPATLNEQITAPARDVLSGSGPRCPA